MMKILGLLFFSCLAMFVGCGEEQEIEVFSVSYDFSNSDNGWLGDFAEYPDGDSINYELFYKYDTLPTNLNLKATKHALHASGINYNDDLFMFVKKKIAGLKPNTTYAIQFSIKIASNVPTGTTRGDSVFLKAGATTFEPQKSIVDGVFRMNLDNGAKAKESGTDMVILGNIGVASNTTQYTYIKKYDPSGSSVNANTNSEGELWLIVGTDSDYEGSSTIYYSQIDVLVNQQ